MREIPKQLLDKGIVVAIGWRLAVNRLDIPRGGQIKVIQSRHNALIVEMNRDGFLFGHFRIEEGILLGLTTDIIPRLVVERADLRRRAEPRRNLFACAGTDFNLRKLVGIKDIAAAGERRRASREQRNG